MINYESKPGYISYFNNTFMFATLEAAEEWDTDEALSLIGAANPTSLLAAVQSVPEAAKLTAAILFLAEKIKCTKDPIS